MTVTFLLSSIFENHHHGKEESKIGPLDFVSRRNGKLTQGSLTGKPEYGSEDKVKEAIGEVAKGTNTVAKLSRLKGTRAGVILDERVTEISAAFELDFIS